jgi:hypothetical protein
VSIGVGIVVQFIALLINLIPVVAAAAGDM